MYICIDSIRICIPASHLQTGYSSAWHPHPRWRIPAVHSRTL